MSEAVRAGTIKMPPRQGPAESPGGKAYPQSYLTERPEAKPPTAPFIVQGQLPSDVVPATAFAARARKTPADIAADQLESYMAKLQRGRSTPLTSEVVIQPRLF